MVTKSRSGSPVRGALCMPLCITRIASSINCSKVLSVEAAHATVGAVGRLTVVVGVCTSCCCARIVVATSTTNITIRNNLFFKLFPSLLPDGLGKSLETKLAQSRMAIRSASQRPMVLSVCFLDREIVDARESQSHQPVLIKLPVLIPV